MSSSTDSARAALAAVGLIAPVAAWAAMPTEPGAWAVVGYAAAALGVGATVSLAVALLQYRNRLYGSIIFVYALIAVTSFVFAYACANLCLSNTHPASDPAYDPVLGRVSALYFSIATTSTTGFGDVHPVSESAQLLASSQMFLGFIVIVGVLSALIGHAAQRLATRPQGQAASPSSDEGKQK